MPAPVAPATSRCGILVRSAIKGRPAMSLPRIMVRGPQPLRKSSDEASSLKLTISRSSLGISIPTVSDPGIGAWMRTAMALRARARSSLRLAMRLTRIPGAGRTSYMVTTGPGVMRTSSLWMSKSFRHSISALPRASRSSRRTRGASLEGRLSRSRLGKGMGARGRFSCGAGAVGREADAAGAVGAALGAAAASCFAGAGSAEADAAASCPRLSCAEASSTAMSPAAESSSAAGTTEGVSTMTGRGAAGAKKSSSSSGPETGTATGACSLTGAADAAGWATSSGSTG